MISYISKDVHAENRKVFEHTRSLSQGVYAAETEKMISGVKVYAEPSELIAAKLKKPPMVQFLDRSTISAALLCSQSKKRAGKIGALNFADALVPGGLVEYGEVTQEESLCRCSNLYEGLILPQCMEDYYGYNRALGGHIYSDRLIYSPDVLVFKHDPTHTPVRSPFFVDMITCPSPSGPCEEDILVHRIKGILRAAGANGVSDIILGAWGCGAFGQDAKMMGRCFATALKECPYFENVYFAMISVVKATDRGNDYYFQEGFRDVYGF